MRPMPPAAEQPSPAATTALHATPRTPSTPQQPGPFRSLFLSHGAPSLALQHEHPTWRFFNELGRQLPRPRGAIVVSPHWRGPAYTLKSPAQFETWHDFSGFPPRLYAQRYPARGDAVLLQTVLNALHEAVLPATVSADPRLDHGVWVPLQALWPDATVPLLQIAVTGGGPAAHWALGAALRPLAAAGLLVIGSGGLVHNLSELAAPGTPPPDWAQAFATWIDAQLHAGDRDALLDYRHRAPHAARAQPIDDHLLPLFTAAAAGGAATRLHAAYDYGSLSLAAYGFADG